MEFTWTKQDVRVAHLNLREEMHGEESKQAVDVKLSASVPNDFLSYLSPTLKWSLYDKAEQPDLADDGKHMPRLRYPEMASIKWGGEMQRADVTFHGAKEKFDWAVDAKVGKLVLDCLDGGTVQVTCNVTFYPKPEQVGALAGILGRDVKVSIEAGDPDAGS